MGAPMAEPLRLPMALPPAPAEHPDVAYTGSATAFNPITVDATAATN